MACNELDTITYLGCDNKCDGYLATGTILPLETQAREENPLIPRLYICSGPSQSCSTVILGTHHIGGPLSFGKSTLNPKP